MHKNTAINIDNHLSAELYFAYYTIWSFSITLIWGPLIKGEKSKRQGAESQNIEKVKTKPDATKIQLLGHRKHWKILPCDPYCTVTLRTVTRTERRTGDLGFATMETREQMKYFELLKVIYTKEEPCMGFPGRLSAWSLRYTPQPHLTSLLMWAPEVQVFFQTQTF